jgi:ADP-heptose:LPS heptosyltransferase
MSKPKLLYIGSAGLGENIFSASAMHLLCNDYDVYFCFKKHFYHFLSKYDFVENALWYTSDAEVQLFSTQSECEYYTSHFEHIINNYNFLKLKPIYHKKIFCDLSYSENVIKRLGYNFDYESVKHFSLTPKNPDNIKKIVLYIGSAEPLRRLNDSVFNVLLENLNNHFKDKFTVIGLADSRSKLPFLENYNYIQNKHDEESANTIINLFSSGVDLLIGPDSGFTHLALSYDTPIIFFESRERFEQVIPKVYKNICKVYRKIKPVCLKDCRAQLILEQKGAEHLDHIPHIKNLSENYPRQLLCYGKDPCPCLDFNHIDISNIINIAKELLSQNSSS